MGDFLRKLIFAVVFVPLFALILFFVEMASLALLGVMGLKLLFLASNNLFWFVVWILPTILFGWFLMGNSSPLVYRPKPVSPEQSAIRDRIRNDFVASKYSGLCYDCEHMWHKRSSSPHVCPRCGGEAVDFK